MTEKTDTIKSLDDLAKFVNYSLLEKLKSDPESNPDGVDHRSREVFSGHYVPVRPTPINDPEYILHSKNLFKDLNFDDELAQNSNFIKLFSGDISHVPYPMSKVGWATGYALSIYGREYYQQCPFQTGNGYGDGRAISVVEALLNGRRWEMQLKGGGMTPYCRGADGRAVLRYSVREFLAQESMHALGVPTSRSLSLFVSKKDKVTRPWYSHNSYSKNPDIMISESVAITTRVASSFLRVGQLELFGRRARKSEHPKAMEELDIIMQHLIEREYSEVIDKDLPSNQKVIRLASEYLDRLTSLVANWIRVGYCQGNFNSDNCAAGGFTLDYGPFGFCDDFNPRFQPWTGGGQHFSFLNQPEAAVRNFHMFCLALSPLLNEDQESQDKLKQILSSFPDLMKKKLEDMWRAKLGLDSFDTDLVKNLFILMMKTTVDYTIFFRELSMIPKDFITLKKSFYNKDLTDELNLEWTTWFTQWRSKVQMGQNRSIDEISVQMKKFNPKYILREWLLAPAYQAANEGDYQLIRELNEVMTLPYDEQSMEIEEKYYRLKSSEFSSLGGISHMSCSS